MYSFSFGTSTSNKTSSDQLHVIFMPICNFLSSYLFASLPTIPSFILTERYVMTMNCGLIYISTLTLQNLQEHGQISHMVVFL